MIWAKYANAFIRLLTVPLFLQSPLTIRKRTATPKVCFEIPLFFAQPVIAGRYLLPVHQSTLRFPSRTSLYTDFPFLSSNNFSSNGSLFRCSIIYSTNHFFTTPLILPLNAPKKTLFCRSTTLCEPDHRFRPAPFCI